MEKSLSDAWGGLAFRGLLLILFGIAAVFWPGLTLATFVYLFGGFVLASGIISLVMGLMNVYNTDTSMLTRILMVIVGVVEIGIGVYLLRHIGVTFATLILLVGFTLIIRGIIDLFAGLFETAGAMHKTVMIIGGLITVAAGILCLFQPAASGIAFVWILGLYALITGPLLIALAMDIKNAPVNTVARRKR